MVTPLPETTSGVPRGTELPGNGCVWSEDDVNERLEVEMRAAFEHVLQTAQRYAFDRRTAASVPAIDRVTIVTRMRGRYA